MSQKTVLIVEDDPICRESLKDLFEMEDYNCLEASGGRDAVEIVKANKNAIDLIVSDIRMPNGNGVELLMSVKAMDPSIPPVILITGFSTAEEESLVEKGAECVLSKPIDFAELFAEVEKAIAKFKAA
ncbi:MAG: response regulator [Bdellovibrionaceae bacterium]|nr:response regulator [Bdellovibrionales bacterium]MCB9084122.1 response regulator [Pseudobdellovibrionaceae bacterium]